MSNFLTTLAVAAIVVVLALLLMGIGWLITGKSKIVRGGCGMDPNKRRDDNCDRDTSCSLCGRNPDDEKKK